MQTAALLLAWLTLAGLARVLPRPLPNLYEVRP